MSEIREFLVTDIIQSAQDYILSGGTENKEFLVEAADGMKKHYISVSTESINRAIKEGMEQAIFYDFRRELYRLYELQEITKEEFENNPIRKAHEEYAGEIVYRVADLSISCVIYAITSGKSLPPYDIALERALKRAEKFIANIVKKTSCSAEIASYVTRHLVADICRNAYDVFHKDRYEEFRKLLLTHHAKSEEIFEHPVESKRSSLWQELEEIRRELDTFQLEYEKNILRLYETDSITSAIINKLFPGTNPPTDAIKKAKEASKSEPLRHIYDILPNSPVTNLVKRISMSAGKKIAVSKSAKVRTQETLNGKYLVSYKGSSGNEEYEISIDNLQALKRRQSAKLRKVMNFILIKANEQHFPNRITFTLDEYMSKTGATSKEAAYRAAKNELEMLLGFKIAGTVRRGKKERISSLDYIFTGRDVSFNQCEVRCNPGHVQLMCQYFSLLPQWAGELKTKAYDLLDYIYYMARQNIDKIRERGHFNISLKAVNDYLGSHSPDETRRHTEYIIDPTLNAITEIEETQKNNELKITPFYDHDYKNAHDFLNGYLQIEMEPTALNYYIGNGRNKTK